MTQAIATQDEHAVKTGVVLIPLNKLKSRRAQRKTPHAKVDIEALAASIHANYLDSLHQPTCGDYFF